MVCLHRDYLVERHLRSAAAGDQHLAQLLRILPEIARITNLYREALPAFDGGCQVLAAGSCFDGILHIRDIQAVAVGSKSIHGHLQIRRAGNAFGIQIDSSWNLPHHLFDLLRFLFDHSQVGTEYFNADLRAKCRSKAYRCGCESAASRCWSHRESAACHPAAQGSRLWSAPQAIDLSA